MRGGVPGWTRSSRPGGRRRWWPDVPSRRRRRRRRCRGEARRLARGARAARHLTALVAEAGPALLDVEGTTWGIVALALVAGRPNQAREMLERARLQIDLARARTTRVVVLPHWGHEGQADPTPQQED